MMAKTKEGAWAEKSIEQDIEMQNTFPNPLNINLGSGLIEIIPFEDGESQGLIFRDTEEAHEVGSVSERD